MIQCKYKFKCKKNILIRINGFKIKIKQFKTKETTKVFLCKKSITISTHTITSAKTRLKTMKSNKNIYNTPDYKTMTQINTHTYQSFIVSTKMSGLTCLEKEC